MNKTEIVRWIFIAMFLIGSGEMVRGIYLDAKEYNKQPSHSIGLEPEAIIVREQIQASLEMLDREGLINLPKKKVQSKEKNFLLESTFNK